ncbi:MAG: GNAT family N-acetyltransferase [Enterococcus sp.]
MILETKRLILREWQASEWRELARFLQDERVMSAYEGGFSDQEVQKWLAWNLQLYQDYGYGLWAIVRKSDNQVIGECGLTNQLIEGKSHLEIGYHLVFEEWHQGYAIEAAQAVKAYAFDQLQVKRVCSTVRDTNLASLNVAIRNGMVIKKRFIKVYKGVTMPHYLLEVERK